MAVTDILLSKKTFRERIVEHLKERYLAQVAGTDGAIITWGVVSRKPLTKQEQSVGYALGIYDTSEKVKANIGHDMRFLNVVLEFHVAIKDDETDHVGSIMNAVLGEVQRVAGIDIQMGEDDPAHPGQPPSYKLAINTEERGSELEIGSEKPSVCAGVCVLEVTYRTKSNDPFRR